MAEGHLVVQFGVRRDVWPGGPFLGFEMPAGEYSRDFACMMVQLHALTPRQAAGAGGPAAGVTDPE